jgi:RHS repeat-associated protein
MAYDAEGNMTSKTRVSDGENWTYTWDDRNRLTQVVEKTSGGVTVTNDVFTYDVENRRIGKSVINGTQTWYGYDGQNSYADFNGSGSLTMRYLTGQALDSLYARFDGTNTSWYLDDMLGSVRQVSNTSGTLLDTLTYDSYGQILSESNSSNGDRFKYTSREWDSEIGQYFSRARSYSAFDGRFTSQDPIGFGGHDLDLYRYAANRPDQLSDPSGLLLAMYEGMRDSPEPAGSPSQPTAPNAGASNGVSMTAPAGPVKKYEITHPLPPHEVDDLITDDPLKIIGEGIQILTYAFDIVNVGQAIRACVTDATDGTHSVNDVWNGAVLHYGVLGLQTYQSKCKMAQNSNVWASVLAHVKITDSNGKVTDGGIQEVWVHSMTQEVRPVQSGPRVDG